MRDTMASISIENEWIHRYLPDMDWLLLVMIRLDAGACNAIANDALRWKAFAVFYRFDTKRCTLHGCSRNVRVPARVYQIQADTIEVGIYVDREMAKHQFDTQYIRPAWPNYSFYFSIFRRKSKKNTWIFIDILWFTTAVKLLLAVLIRNVFSSENKNCDKRLKMFAYFITARACALMCSMDSTHKKSRNVNIHIVNWRLYTKHKCTKHQPTHTR